jgi:hypothetical protein
MAFTVPNFNLVCNIFSVSGGVHVFRSNCPCNLAAGRRSSSITDAYSQDGGLATASWALLVPKGTDIRDSSCGGEMDLLEVPAGSGRFYLARGVDDIGKGFANEYRCVFIGKTWNFPGNGSGLVAPWPTPIP